ncbi:MAG: hypothetical protein MJ248_02900 [Bacilli bacterium]|nr:hypothetical protein [Bacilli bacterium]
MKKKLYFNSPVFELIKLDSEDVISTSTYGWGDPDSDLLIEEDEWGIDD